MDIFVAKHLDLDEQQGVNTHFLLSHMLHRYCFTEKDSNHD